MKEIQELFVCECNTLDHNFIFSDIPDINESYEDSGPYLHVHLNPKYSFFERIKLALKYIFGFRSRFGDYDEIILKPDDLIKLRNLLNESIKNRGLNE